MSDDNIAETVQQLTESRMLAGIIMADHTGRSWLITKEPDGATAAVEITDPHGLKPRPSHVVQAVSVATEQSLAAYVGRFHTEVTMLFADVGANRIDALLDYHDASVPALYPPSALPPAGTPSGPSSPERESQANHTAHRAVLNLPFSEEWNTWIAPADKAFVRWWPHLDFARFLRENMEDITIPSAGDLLDAVKSLTAAKATSFKQDVDLSSDHVTFHLDDAVTVRGKADVEVPTELEITIPVYFDGELFDITAFLRHKVEDGRLQLGLAFKGVNKVRQLAFNRIVERLDAATKVPIVHGKTA
jgi:hypothetical protein